MPGRHGIYERSGIELARGAGLVTHPELFEVLANAGARVTEEDLGVPVVGRRTLDREGRILAERPLPQTLTSLERLFGLRCERVPECYYLKGGQLERVEQSGSEVVARFADGTSSAGDLLVRRRRHPYHGPGAVRASKLSGCTYRRNPFAVTLPPAAA